ncbi:MAG: hypothetical protein RJB39_313 [Candidatus Parcubacteria bacterium]|jgi:(p)ppGpp synthase/HD superfamily hydrolase
MKPHIAIERAMALVQTAFVGQFRTGQLRAPASTHSLRAGLYALAAQRPIVTVLGAFCHDLLEDTQVTPGLIRATFDGLGDRVVELVEACTIDPGLGDNPIGENELYQRVCSIAKKGDLEPLWIKTADSLDNLRTNDQLWLENQWPAIERAKLWLKSFKKYWPGQAMLRADLANMIRINERRLKRGF